MFYTTAQDLIDHLIIPALDGHDTDPAAVYDELYRRSLIDYCQRDDTDLRSPWGYQMLGDADMFWLAVQAVENAFATGVHYHYVHADVNAITHGYRDYADAERARDDLRAAGHRAWIVSE